VLGKSKQFHLTVKEYMSAFSLAHNIRWHNRYYIIMV
jgi:hypothetical protein